MEKFKYPIFILKVILGVVLVAIVATIIFASCSAKDTARVTILQVVEFDSPFTVHHDSIRMDSPTEGNIVVVCLIKHGFTVVGTTFFTFGEEGDGSDPMIKLRRLIGKTVKFSELEGLLQ